MRARYRDLQVSLAEPGRRLRVACTVENEGPDAWSPAAGFAFSYQIFDPATGTLLEDGKRTVPAGDIAAGQSAPLELAVPLPAEPGQYRIYVSPLVEHQAWFYETGSPFVLVDARVAGGRAELKRHLVATLGRVRSEALVRSLGRAFWYPFRTLVRHRSLIRSLVRRDVAGRYRGSYGGLFWTVIHPLLMMVTYYFVFGIVLRSEERRVGKECRL